MESAVDIIDIHHPSRKYNLIIADPPWEYDTNGYMGSTKNHYNTMSISEICKLPVEELAAENCALFLWCTAPMMQKAFQVIESWGFTYKTVFFNWIKTCKHKCKPTQRVTGWYTRNAVEYVLVATKGNINQFRDKSLAISSIFEQYSAVHSEKPMYPMQMIVKMYGNLPRVELFARKKTYGWDCWGDQISTQPSVHYDMLVKQQSLKELHKQQLEITKTRPSTVMKMKQQNKKNKVK